METPEQIAWEAQGVRRLACVLAVFTSLELLQKTLVVGARSWAQQLQETPPIIIEAAIWWGIVILATLVKRRHMP